MSRKNDGTEPSARRGFLRALGLGTAAAAATAGTAAAQATAPANPRTNPERTVVRADSVPPGEARKETAAQRVAPRYRADSAHVQAFYRTNRFEH